MNTLELFLEKIRSEKIASHYADVFDKYLNGDCQTITLNLAVLTTFKGKQIEIRQENFFDYCFHYVYKIDGFFYDIRGKFNSIEEIINATEYFDIEEEYETKEINFNYYLKDKENFKNLLFLKHM